MGIWLLNQHYLVLKIIVRADSGFINAKFYKLADDESLFYAVSLATNERLKKIVSRAKKAVEILYQHQKIKHQHFISFQVSGRVMA